VSDNIILISDKSIVTVQKKKHNTEENKTEHGTLLTIFHVIVLKNITEQMMSIGQEGGTQTEVVQKLHLD